MKKIITIVIIACGFNYTFAQQDPAAKEILDKLSQETKSHQTISTDFKVEFKNIKENIQNSNEGKITMKGDMYRLKFMNSESFFDGKTLWSFLAEVNEVNITEPEPDDEDIFNNPKRLFTIYEKDYKYQLIGDLAENGKNYALVDLYPNDLHEDFSRIRLQINVDEYFLSSATIFGKDGSHYTISLHNYKTNLNFDDSYFTFNEKDHPKVEIIDMRF